MSEILVQRIQDHIRLNERVADYPYPDNKGRITSGAGFLMDDRNSFMKQPWEIRSGNATRPATQAEKEEAWQKLRDAGAEQSKGANKRADSYENATPLRLPQDVIEADLNAKVRQHMEQARKEIGAEAWDKLTDGQKTAITDVHYARGNLDEYINLKQGVENGDPAKMARQIGIRSGTDSNNNPIRNWDRERRNHAAILGIDPDSNEAWKATAEKYQGEMNLPEAYRKHLPTPQPAEPPRVPETPGTDGQAFMERIGQPNERPALDVAIKEPQHWTKEEADTVIQDYLRHPRPEPLNGWLREQTTAYFKSRHGGAEWVGGAVSPIFKGAPPVTTPPYAPMPDDKVVLGALDRLSTRLAPLFDADGTISAAKAMQQGLNLLNDGRMPRLKEDGDWGPITDFSFKKGLARQGAARLDEGFALGRLQTLAEKPRRPEELSKRMQSIFGPLYGSQPGGRETKPHHALALQAGLNAVGPKYQEGWRELKLDGDIGPKTTNAFNQTASAAGPRAFAREMGEWLGWLS